MDAPFRIWHHTSRWVQLVGHFMRHEEAAQAVLELTRRSPYDAPMRGLTILPEGQVPWETRPAPRGRLSGLAERLHGGTREARFAK